MKTNVGKFDQKIRYALAIIFAILAIRVSPYFWILAVISVATAYMSFCGIYKIFGINTCKMK